MRWPPRWLGVVLALASACAGTRSAGKPTAPAPTLRFEDFFVPGQAALVPSRQLLAARGQRVRMVGFMAEMEMPPAQGFYLTSRPISCDEAGGGTADLPPDAVRVLITPPPAQPIPHLRGPIEITGVLETGVKDERDGTVSHIRLLLKGG
jgi:hypothetical protein